MLNPTEPLIDESSTLETPPQPAETLQAWAQAVLSDSRVEPMEYLKETVVPHGGE
jgi:hypothetical protein